MIVVVDKFCWHFNTLLQGNCTREYNKWHTLMSALYMHVKPNRVLYDNPQLLKGLRFYHSLRLVFPKFGMDILYIVC